MDLIKLFATVVLICAFSISTQAQHVKPKFKKILCTDYGYDSYGKGVNIDKWLEFNEDGTLHYISIEVGKNHFGTADTTYSIPDTLMIELNKVFNGKKPLKSHMIIDTLPKGTKVSGRAYFITYTTENNLEDNFIAVKPFLDEKLSVLLDKIWHLQRAVMIQKNKVYHDEAIQAQVLKYHKECKYVPKVPPPTVKFLEIAAPPANH